MHHIRTEEILFIEAAGNYTKVFVQDHMILSHEKISSLEELLPSSDFLRVHKSFLVAVDKIEVVEGNRISIGSHLIPIGQTYKQQLKRLFRRD